MDLSTLWYLTIGTLALGAAMTWWERMAQPRRATELAFWTAGYLTLAFGCVLAMHRIELPGVSGWAATNLVIMAGYLLVLHGVRRLDGPVGALGSLSVMAMLSAIWIAFGAHHADLLWNHVTALPIAVTSGITAWVLWRSRAARPHRSRNLAIAISLCHALVYASRSLVTPVIASIYGDWILPIAAKVTMYEGVLYSVALPISLLALIREEYQAQLLATSQTDFLTGLYNRQGFFEQGGRFFEKAHRAGPVTLLAFDLDHFKAINDRYGHDAGDDVLRRFARVAREIAPQGTVARLGGEEFVILLPGESGLSGYRIAEAVAARFADASGEDGRNIAATVSIGVAETGATSSNLVSLLAAADRALYRAKHLGRNRIERATTLAIADAA